MGMNNSISININWDFVSIRLCFILSDFMSGQGTQTSDFFIYNRKQSVVVFICLLGFAESLCQFSPDTVTYKVKL